MTGYKRLSLNERSKIQSGIESHLSLRTIAFSIGRDPSTVSREIKTYRQVLDTRAWNGFRTRCIRRFSCTLTNVCDNHSAKCKRKKCAYCHIVLCSSYCKEYEEEICAGLSRPPYVCNGCEKRSNCSLKKMIYTAADAQKNSELKRSESRSGMCFSEEELKEINDILTPRIRMGQSIHHILSSSPDEFTVCEKTVYTLVHAGKIDARPIDLPRAVRFRIRKKSREVKVDKKCRLGRTYDDYLRYMENNPDSAVLQGDTVEGTKGGKCILTLTWTNAADFQIAFLRDHNDSASVTAIVDHLYESFGYEAFHKVFPSVWLLDNGTEFSNPAEIEKYGIHVFYCDPSAPYQKGSCENTHENIRKVLPKGTPFDDLDQDSFDLLLSHCNSLIRSRFNNRSAYDVFFLMFGRDIDIKEKLHIQPIPPEKVYLKPGLLKDYQNQKSQ